MGEELGCPGCSRSGMGGRPTDPAAGSPRLSPGLPLWYNGRKAIMIHEFMAAPPAGGVQGILKFP